MPTQEELNAAQMELDIANDNYAAMADRYNKFQQLFKRYASESKEVQDRAAPAIGYALEEFEKLKLDMYAAEDRIQQAQNRVNNYNEVIASQPTQTIRSTQWRTISPTNDQLRLKQYINSWYTIWDNWLLYSPNGELVNQNWNNINSNWQFVEAQPVWQTTTILETIPQTPEYKGMMYNPAAHNFRGRMWVSPTYSSSINQPFTYYKSNSLRWIANNAAHNLGEFWKMAKWSFNNMTKALNRASDATGRFLVGNPERL